MSAPLLHFRIYSTILWIWGRPHFGWLFQQRNFHIFYIFAAVVRYELLYSPLNSMKSLKRVQFNGKSIFLFHSYPYDWQTPPAYLLTMAVLTVHFYYMAHLYYIKCSYFGGICKFLMTFCDDFEQTAYALQTKILLNGKSCEVKIKFYEFIKFHWDLKQLSDL